MNSDYRNNNNIYNQNYTYNFDKNNINSMNSNNNYNNNLNNGNLNTNLINNPMMNILLQYMNMMKFNSNNNNINNNNNNNSNSNNFNFTNNNNIMNYQYIPNLFNMGFNQPYSFANIKKGTKKQNDVSFNNKKYHQKYNDNNSNFSHTKAFNNQKNDYFKNDENNEKKFMRKMTKAEKIEIDKWVEARKKLYPTQKNIEIKNKIGELKVEKGLISNLELKLRKKVNILKKLSSSKKTLKRKGENRIFFPNQKHDSQSNKDNEKNNINLNDESGDENQEEKKNILEDGEINENGTSVEKSNNLKDEDNNTNIKNDALLGKKRRMEKRNSNIKKKIGKIKKNGNEKNIRDSNFKKGFKYKVNHLYDELIKKDKIREQNIILQAIRYLINLKDDKDDE